MVIIIVLKCSRNSEKNKSKRSRKRSRNKRKDRANCQSMERRDYRRKELVENEKFKKKKKKKKKKECTLCFRSLF